MNPDWQTILYENPGRCVPLWPHNNYRNAGWTWWGEFLGTGKVASRTGLLPFEEGRAYARTLGITSMAEWRKWAKSNKRPRNIPSHPWNTYEDKGWVNFPDWVGNGGTPQGKMLPFEESRSLVRPLGIKNEVAWRAWCKSDAHIPGIPRTPHRHYRDQWVSWPDWLGNGGKARGKYKT